MHRGRSAPHSCHPITDMFPKIQMLNDLWHWHGVCQDLLHQNHWKWFALKHLQHHLVKDDAFLWGFTLPYTFQPCTACSCCSNLGFRRHNVYGRDGNSQTFSTQDSFVTSQCQTITLELDASIHAGFCTVRLATPNGHIQQSHRSKPAITLAQNSNKQKLQVQSCLFSRTDFVQRQFPATTRPMRTLHEKLPQPIVQAPGFPKVMACWEQMADLLPILRIRLQKQGLWKRNVFTVPWVFHHEILKVSTSPQGSPRSLPTFFQIPIHFPSPQGPQLALLRQVDGSFLVACQDGNVQQPCHRLRGHAEGKLRVAAANV